MLEIWIIILLLILIGIKLKPKQIIQNFSQEKHEDEEDLDAYNIIDEYNI